jgi:hypothetical protein
MMLMPAAVLVILVLGALAVDVAVVHLGERQAFGAATAAANDAATYGIDPSALRRGDEPGIDPARARHAAMASLAGEQTIDPDAAPVVEVDGTSVTVTVTLQLEYIFSQGLPGAPDGTTVTARATADASQR